MVRIFENVFLQALQTNSSWGIQTPPAPEQLWMDSRPVAGAGSTFTVCPPESKFHVHCWRMAPTIEKISAITFRVLNMKASVQFYRNVLGMELLYGGERACFSSLRAKDSESAILNLERGDSVSQWGRLILHVTELDAFWTHLREKGFDPGIP